MYGSNSWNVLLIVQLSVIMMKKFNEIFNVKLEVQA